MRCCEYDSGTGWLRSTFSMGGWRLVWPLAWIKRTCSAKAPSSLASNKVRSGSSTSQVWRVREMIWVASSEWPPRAKKSSRRPMRARPSTSRQMPAICCSRALVGSTCSRTCHCGSGKARRSSLPLGPRGMVSRRSSWVGTM
ncbi:hypothetical protein D3C76_1007820 [compost metagenome]